MKMTTAPAGELEVYSDILTNMISQLANLVHYDKNFVFLEQHYITHKEQVDAIIQMKRSAPDGMVSQFSH